MKKNNKKGFTLAELLIVVAIIAVLVAIAIPVFSAQLDKSKLATATANARSVYAEYIANCLADSALPGDTTALSNSINAAQLQSCTVTVTSTSVKITSPKSNTQSFTIDLGSGS